MSAREPRDARVLLRLEQLRREPLRQPEAQSGLSRLKQPPTPQPRDPVREGPRAVRKGPAPARAG